MTSESFIRVLTIGTALLFSTALASCVSLEMDVYAHAGADAAVNRWNTSVGSVRATSTTGAKSPAMIRDFEGEQAERLGRELGAAKENMRASDHFIYVTPASMHAEALPRIAGLLEHTHEAFFEVFSGMKDRLSPADSPLVWMVFDGRQDYDRYARAADGMDMSWSKAYYSTQTNRVAISLHRDGEGTLSSAATTGSTTATSVIDKTPLSGNDSLIAQITHEAGHQLAFNSGLQTRGVMYPLWVSEGLASNFEMDADGRLGPQSGNILRTKHLNTAMSDNRLMPLEQWVGYTRIPIGRPAQINAVYSQSWAFFRFLYETRRDDLHRYLAHMARQEPGRRSEDSLKQEFIHIFGDEQKLVPLWNGYLSTLQEKGTTPSTPAAAADSN